LVGSIFRLFTAASPGLSLDRGTDKTAAQTKETLERMTTATMETTGRMKDSYLTTMKGAQEYNDWMIEFARINVNAAFDSAQELCGSEIAIGKGRGLNMRIVVDLNRCQGYAQCVPLAPDVLKLHGEEALMYDPNPDDSQRQRVLRAAASCPVQAIMVDMHDKGVHDKGKGTAS